MKTGLDKISRCIILFAALIAMPQMGLAGTAGVDFSSQVQKIEGFGGSMAWLSALTSAQANALFSNGDNQQMGLSILRVRIDPGGQANWGTELQNAWAAQARGAIVIATPWTPPASMKTNDSTVGGSLSTSQYSAYASYLQSYVTYMSSNGAPLYAISMQNEPDANVTYESCTWTGAQMDTWLANDASAISAPILMPESEGFNSSYSDPALDDSQAVDHIGFVAGHIYGTTPQYYTNAFNHGKEVWMTEHYISGSGISEALSVAKEINDSMAIADYSAYLWWWVEDVPSENSYDGLLDSSGNLKPAAYAIGHYSKFVRPGYYRSNATYNPTANIYVTAYKGSGHYVIVAINNGSSAVSQTFTETGAASFTPYQSTVNGYMQQLSSFTVTNNTFTYSLPAQSITTFYY